MKRFFLFVAVLVLATACAGTGGGSGDAGGGAGGDLRVFGDDPITLDPAVMSDTSSAEYVVEIFGGLVTLNRQLRVSPDLAESWTVSPDGKTYTFKLNANAKFHDGKPVTSKDFVYSFERTADPKTNSPTADTYLGDIKGVLEKLNGSVKSLSGLKALDDQTLQIDLDAPRAYFLAKMQYPTAFVVDQKNVEAGGKNWTDKPNGPGPFKLESWDKGNKLNLARNASYHLGPAKLDRVRVNIAGGNGMTMFENDEIDITAIGLADIERIEDKANPLNKNYVIGKSLDLSYVGFNTELPPFDDAKVRQAFAMAVDNGKIVSNVLKDKVTVAKGVLPPDMPGYNPGVKGPKFDPAAAKQLLQDSKYKGVLPPITLAAPGATTSLGPVGDAFLEQWKTNLGVDVKAQTVEFATFLSELKRDPAKGKKNRYQLYMMGWAADYPDPQDFVDILFNSTSLENNGAYKNTEVDTLVNRARSENDEGKRFALYQQAEQIIVNEAAFIPMYHSQHYELVKDYVKGYQPTPLIISKFRYISIEK